MTKPAPFSWKAASSMPLYGAAVFVGAFLLFQVQPLIGKYVLPWFGGSSGVWATTLLFFQVMLLGGYAYAHASTTWLRPRAQAWVHLSLLAVMLLALPIIPSDRWKPSTVDHPSLRILLLLGATVGGPFLMLSTTGPFLQHWFSHTHHGRSPYRLYALSNAASLVALLSFPLLFERFLRLTIQAWIWSGAYLLFTFLCGALAIQQMRASRSGAYRSTTNRPAATAALEAPASNPRRADLVLWLVLPAAASIMLLATTNHITQEIVPVPLLWVLPLSVYLLTFIITFDSDRWYRRAPFTVMFAVSIATVVFIMRHNQRLGWVQLLVAYPAALFFICMSCHGELARLRPGHRHLTLFYLMVAVGGALGGVLVALLAPQVFDGFWEYHVGLVVSALAVLLALNRDAWTRLRTSRSVRRVNRNDPCPCGSGKKYKLCHGRAGRPVAADPRILVAGAAAGVLLLSWQLMTAVAHSREIILFGRRGEVLERGRNFYGAFRVFAARKGKDDWLELVHGQTSHGLQLVAPDLRITPTTYYGPDSGAGLALTRYPARVAGKPLRIGIVGLGTGSLSVYTTAGDYLRLYEINPQMVEVAERRFTYLADAKARGVDTEVLLGDARMVLERQRNAANLQRFDVLVLDAFSGDSTPVHLLTKEAFQLYVDHLTPDGVIAVNVGAEHLDISPVIRALAKLHGLRAYAVDSAADMTHLVYAAHWIVVTANQQFFADEKVRVAVKPWPANAPQPVLWTDEYSNLLRLVR